VDVKVMTGARPGAIKLSDAMASDTAERRVTQATRIHHWKPWKRSTGPYSVEGKATVSQNAVSRLLAQTLKAWSGGKS
jgi:hypothetical protein